MNVHSWFFTREKVESEWSTAKDCWAHWSMLFAIPPGINKGLAACIDLESAVEFLFPISPIGMPVVLHRLVDEREQIRIVGL